MKVIKILIITLLVSSMALSACKKQSLVDTNANQLTDITSSSQFDEHIKTGVSLVFYHASWCTVCKEQRPAVEALPSDADLDQVKFGELEYDDHTSIANAQNVNSFPTIVIYKNGAEVDRLRGKGHSVDDLKTLLLSHL